jgi:DNA-binding PadR family transcriptional regulator
MAARTTRLAVLGAVRRLQPATGYDVQSYLFGMAADRWLALRSGSIYAMLQSLRRESLIEADPDDPARHVVTAAGHTEHDRLLVNALRVLPETGDTAELRVALHFADLLPVETVRRALTDRLAAIEDALSDITARIDAAGPAASSLYVTHRKGLEHALLRAQSEWLRNLLDQVLSPRRSRSRGAARGRGADE